MEENCKRYNLMSYCNYVARDIVPRSEILEVFKRIAQARKGKNTAVIGINFKILMERMKRRDFLQSKMKILRASETLVSDTVEELLNAAELQLDDAFRGACSNCSGASSPAEAKTTHGSDLPIHLPTGCQRFLFLPGIGGTTEGRGRLQNRLVVEQIGRYDGPYFIPNRSGKHLFWTARGGNLTSKTCCLMDYLAKRGARDYTRNSDTIKSRYVESISLQLETTQERDNTILREIEKEIIEIALIL